MTDESNKNIQVRKENTPSVPGEELLQQALTSLTDEQKQSLSGKAADEALRLQSKQAEMWQKDAQSRQETMDHMQTYEGLEKKGIHSHKIVSEMETGAGRRTITSTSGARCFVVTAAYGDEGSPMVQFFQGYRDQVLSKYRLGRAFIGWYYQHGPGYAKWLDRHPNAKPLVRRNLAAIGVVCRWHQRHFSRKMK